MSIPVTKGDIIVAIETQRVKLGTISMEKLNNNMMFGVPKGFVEDAKEALSTCPENVCLWNHIPEGILYGANGIYDLNQYIEISAKDGEMYWYVSGVDEENDKYELLAIGESRARRTEDWMLSRCLFINSDDLPGLEDYIRVKDVNSTFFIRKAVFRFNETNPEEKRFNNN